MRIKAFGPFLALIGLGCAARAIPSTSPADNCPFRVLATVDNPQPIPYDVYYHEQAKPGVVLGEIMPNSNTTFQIPGEGRGFVRLQRQPNDRTPIPNTGRPLPETRIRLHCP